MNYFSNPDEIQLSIASMNGDYSVSTNDTFARSLFRHGFCVSTKRVYSSNIKGAPARYLIRVSKKQFQSAADKNDIAVILFDEKIQTEIKELKKNGRLIYDPFTETGQKISRDIREENEDSLFYRPDIQYYAVPFEKLAGDNFRVRRLRQIARNMICVGFLSLLLALTEETVKKVFIENFADKGEKIVDCNLEAFEIGRKYAEEKFSALESPPDPGDEKNKARLFMTGNDASALGAVIGGCNYVSWYPITPATSHGENLERYSQKYPIIVEQAENEDSCLGRALGAAWAGARSSVSSSGPGLSNMAEFIGYSSFAEIPVVIFDVQRVGPATGLPTHSKQGDLRYLLHSGHDESPRVVLTPSSVEEIFEYSRLAFDIADKYQLPVVVVSELILGECFYSVDRFEYPDSLPQRGKILTDDQLEEVENFKRFEDVDNDGICPRTLPGQKPTYTVRGAYHDRSGRLSEEPADCAEKIERLFKKMETLKNSDDLPSSTVENEKGCPGFIAFGSSVYTVKEARRQLVEKGIKTGLFVLSSLSPLPVGKLKKFIDNHTNIYVLEQNYSGQLLSILKEQVGHYQYLSIRKYDGSLLRPEDVRRPVMEEENNV